MSSTTNLLQIADLIRTGLGQAKPAVSSSTIYNAEASIMLRVLEEESVDPVITSPPYQLRSNSMRIRITIEELDGVLADETTNERLTATAMYNFYNDGELERAVHDVLIEFQMKHALACGICPIHAKRHIDELCPGVVGETCSFTLDLKGTLCDKPAAFLGAYDGYDRPFSYACEEHDRCPICEKHHTCGGCGVQRMRTEDAVHKEMKPPKRVEAGGHCAIHDDNGGQTFSSEAIHHACGCPVLRGQKRMDAQAVADAMEAEAVYEATPEQIDTLTLDELRADDIEEE